MSFSVDLAGEIHTEWREEIRRGAQAAGPDVTFTEPVTDQPASDTAGDRPGEKADLVVVRFGDGHKQWNAADDAGARAWCATTDQVVDTLRYILRE